MITVKVNDDEVQAAFQKILDAAVDLNPFYETVGEQQTHSTKQRFADGEAPDGTAWAKNTELTLSRKKGSNPLIAETKGLSNEIHYVLLNDGVMIGSSKEYAAIQQFGAKQYEFGQGKHKTPWGDIPARPFLGVSDDDRDAITELARLHLLGK